MNRLLISAALALTLGASLMGCAAGDVATAPEPQPPAPPATTSETPAPEPSAATVAWVGIPLTDAVTGKEFKLSDYKGKPVLLHPFAAW